MAFCKACGQEIGTVGFCPKCGANQSATQVAPASTVPSASAPTEGIAENVAALLCYMPFFGWIAAIVFFLVDKRFFVKFHAVQSLALHVALVVISIALGIFMGMLHIMHLWFLGALIYPLFWLAIFVLWIFLIIKAYQHETFKLPVLGDFAAGIASK